MTVAKARTIIGNRVVALTRYLMEREGVPRDVAYAKLFGTEFFTLLSDSETGLFLEDDDYLRTAYLKEVSEGADAMYEFVRPEP